MADVVSTVSGAGADAFKQVKNLSPEAKDRLQVFVNRVEMAKETLREFLAGYNEGKEEEAARQAAEREEEALQAAAATLSSQQHPHPQSSPPTTPPSQPSSPSSPSSS